MPSKPVVTDEEPITLLDLLTESLEPPRTLREAARDAVRRLTPKGRQVLRDHFHTEPDEIDPLDG